MLPSVEAPQIGPDDFQLLTASLAAVGVVLDYNEDTWPEMAPRTSQEIADRAASYLSSLDARFAVPPLRLVRSGPVQSTDAIGHDGEDSEELERVFLGDWIRLYVSHQTAPLAHPTNVVPFVRTAAST